jgi:antitoxin (DNA-binding transcriptional repressor) of toxin-antitoxin stability system
MQRTTITVTEAARNFAECVNRAHYQNVTFVLLKNGAPVARLVPDGGKLCTGRDLAQSVNGHKLPPGEARAWSRETRRGRNSLRPPRTKW